jgi:hypothetical protein
MQHAVRYSTKNPKVRIGGPVLARYIIDIIACTLTLQEQCEDCDRVASWKLQYDGKLNGRLLCGVCVEERETDIDVENYNKYWEQEQKRKQQSPKTSTQNDE